MGWGVLVGVLGSHRWGLAWGVGVGGWGLGVGGWRGNRAWAGWIGRARLGRRQGEVVYQGVRSVPSRNWEVILFDLDRTLVDVQSFTDYGAAWADLSRQGLTAAAQLPETGWDAPTLRCMGALAAWSGDERWNTVSRMIEKHESAAVPRSVLMPGVTEALGAVGDRRVSVVTLMGPTAARASLARHGIPIHRVVGRRSDLAPKPAPDQLLAACSELGVGPSEALMVGDSTWDAVAAEAAGADFIGVTNGADSEFDPGTEVISSLTELVGILRGRS